MPCSSSTVVEERIGFVHSVRYHFLRLVTRWLGVWFPGRNHRHTTNTHLRSALYPLSRHLLSSLSSTSDKQEGNGADGDGGCDGERGEAFLLLLLLRLFTTHKLMAAFAYVCHPTLSASLLYSLRTMIRGKKLSLNLLWLLLSLFCLVLSHFRFSCSLALPVLLYYLFHRASNDIPAIFISIYRRFRI